MPNLDPLAATRRIGESYRRYLVSTFAPRRPDLAREFAAALGSREIRLTRGPFLQATPPFEPGASVQDLIVEGVLHPFFERLDRDAFPIDRPLHRHQEVAVRKAVESRNLIITTGTGSGKTETFLIPILNRLFQEADAGTLGEPGVRALLLYPMNALANDQVKRLRRLLVGLPQVTFGRYVGDTEETEGAAANDFARRFPNEPRLPNELLSRERMKAGPPHFLLTNYAMLEYLLLRPTDSSLFDGPLGARWRHVVLDEAHTYNGAQGTEVAMLLRRLKDRVVASEPGRLQCFATSATLGRGRGDYPALIQFATDLFGERFEWDDDDSTRQDIVTATRLPLVRGAKGGRLAGSLVRDLQREYRLQPSVASLAAVAERHGVNPPATTSVSTSRWLHDLLVDDQNVIELQAMLESGSVELADAARALGEAGTVDETVALVDLCVAAREHPDDAPLIPARYHYFVRALEGGYLCLHPGHRDGEARLVLARHDWCPSCARRGTRARTFEIGVCRHCHSEYLIGDLAPGGGVLTIAPPFRPGRAYALLGAAIDDDEDEAAAGVDDVARDQRSLCPACGAIREQGACGCDSSPGIIPVTVARAGDDGMLHTCIACSGRAAGDVVLSLTTGTDAPVSVIATDLYQSLPASEDSEQAARVGEGRKLLAFADSRQDAAYFAPYLERTYRRAVQRRLIAEAIERLSADGAPRGHDLVEILRDPIQQHVLIEDAGNVAVRREAGYWIATELLALDRRQSLEGTGTAEISVAIPPRFAPPRPLLDLGFDAHEVEALLQLLLETVRGGGALTTPDQVTIRDDRFAPRNVDLGVRERGSGAGVITWLPGSGLNRRLEIVRKAFERKGISTPPLEVLENLWRYLTDPNGPWASTLVATTTKSGPLWKLDWRACEFRLLADDHRPHRCDRCGRLTWWTIAGLCPAWGCPGTVREVEDIAELRSNHYASLYRELEPIGISVQEHTAQWDSARAGEIQQEFLEGRVNVLSCSTTFELGVDVGAVQAVLLRNVPPGPANYVQRAGRAGRRTDSAALVVTFAQRRNHDLHYFASPTAMVDGLITPPRILLDNPLIVRRHAHSVAFAAFEREHVDGGGTQHRDVEEFFAPADGHQPPFESFVAWLRARPATVEAALHRIVPAATRPALGLDDWDWVKALAEPDPQDPTHGWLMRAADEVRDDLETLRLLEDDAGAAKNYRLAAKYERTRNTLARKPLLNFLASRNVLPKYGFPVDVVQLDLTWANDVTGAALDLSRDLKLAIREYAPGNHVVAGKKLWKSVGLAVRAGREWPTYHWAVCRDCGVYTQRLQQFEECGGCGSLAFATRGTLVIPLFGFVGNDAGEPGDSRPARTSSTKAYFGSYKSEVSEFAPVPGLTPTAGVVARANRQGRIAVINEGHGGYRICERCGAAGPPSRGKKTDRAHTDIRFPGRSCEGKTVHRQLGHEFLTDVVEIRFGSSMSWARAQSVLYALLEGAAAATSLSISRDDIDGTLHAFGADRGSFILFDAVPGGAGHAQRIHDNLAEVFAAALSIVRDCECGEETSCYLCLRSYSNQFDHELLSRGAARDALAAALG